MNEEFVICALYADENTIELPEEEWVTDERGRTLKTLGRRNLYYERSMFNMNAQPYYVIIDSDGRVLTRENFQYDRNKDHFLAFLREGLETFRQ